MHDLVIEGASVVDGTGAPARAADVAVRGGLIVEVGRITDQARERIYGMPFADWKARHQREATPEQLAAFKAAQERHG